MKNLLKTNNCWCNFIIPWPPIYSSHQGIRNISKVRDYFRWSKGRTWYVHYTFTVRTSSTQFLPVHVMRSQGEVDGNKGLAPRILNLCNTRSGQLHAPNALLIGKSHLYPMNRGLGGPLSRSARVGKSKYLSTQSRSELEPWFLGSPARRLVTISRLPTKTTQLQFWLYLLDLTAVLFTSRTISASALYTKLQ